MAPESTQSLVNALSFELKAMASWEGVTLNRLPEKAPTLLAIASSDGGSDGPERAAKLLWDAARQVFERSHDARHPVLSLVTALAMPDSEREIWASSGIHLPGPLLTSDGTRNTLDSRYTLLEKWIGLNTGWSSSRTTSQRRTQAGIQLVAAHLVSARTNQLRDAGLADKHDPSRPDIGTASLEVATQDLPDYSFIDSAATYVIDGSRVVSRVIMTRVIRLNRVGIDVIKIRHKYESDPFGAELHFVAVANCAVVTQGRTNTGWFFVEFRVERSAREGEQQKIQYEVHVRASVPVLPSIRNVASIDGASAFIGVQFDAETVPLVAWAFENCIETSIPDTPDSDGAIRQVINNLNYAEFNSPSQQMGRACGISWQWDTNMRR